LPDPGTAVAAAGARSPAAAAPDAEPTDPAVLRALAAFRSALSAGALLEPDSASAWFVYRQTTGQPAAALLLPDLRADLRQKLQVDAQRVIDGTWRAAIGNLRRSASATPPPTSRGPLN